MSFLGNFFVRTGLGVLGTVCLGNGVFGNVGTPSYIYKSITFEWTFLFLGMEKFVRSGRKLVFERLILLFGKKD